MDCHLQLSVRVLDDSQRFFFLAQPPVGNLQTVCGVKDFGQLFGRILFDPAIWKFPGWLAIMGECRDI